MHYIYGYANIFLNPTRYTPVETKILICSITNDEYVQQQNTIISESKQFKIIKELQNGNCYKISNYLLIVKNSCIRKVITRLRIDMNNLNECINSLNVPF